MNTFSFNLKLRKIYFYIYDAFKHIQVFVHMQQHYVILPLIYCIEDNTPLTANLPHKSDFNHSQSPSYQYTPYADCLPYTLPPTNVMSNNHLESPDGHSYYVGTIGGVPAARSRSYRKVWKDVH